MGLPLAPRAPLGKPLHARPDLPHQASQHPTQAPLASVGRYEPFRHLGTGPDGAAALARVRGASEFVELHYASASVAHSARWKSIEAAIHVYALLDHPGWIKLIDQDAADGRPVLVLEGHDAVSLESIASRAALGEAQLVSIGERIAHALGAAHRIGYIHGRIAPSRVRLTNAGVPMLDFTRLDVGPAATTLDAACVPPEAGLEALDASSDVFSLGKLLATLRLGRAPLEGESLGVLHAIVTAMTQRDRELRPSAAEACIALRSIARSALPQGSPDETWSAASTTLPGPGSRVHGGEVAAGTRLGRYQLVRKLGEGGMGQVFRAVDLGTGAEAAIKVLHPEASRDPEQLRRFRKEARILAEVRSPYVAQLLEVNQDEGIDYLALEFVDGRTLGDVLEADGGRLSERESLALIADVCRGLGEAHVRGIIHRDIKPDNVMVAHAAAGSDGQPRVKLCDFGIARMLDARPGTLAVTREGAIIGTPFFMAPEQCTGAALSPATDVYALGITLFNLMSGRMPFTAEEPMAVLVAHVNQAPPTLSSICPEISEATSALVAKTLSKNPVDRFADAGALLDAIERIERGEPTNVAVHPTRPQTDPRRIAQHVFEFDLRASAEDLWPFISNTDRLNRVLGMAPPSFERKTEGDEVTTFGSNRVAGVDLKWREYPFEWVEGRKWGVLRTFDGGVMHWFTVEIALVPLAAGGTRVRFVMTLEPRHFLGRLIVAAEMKWKQKPRLEKALARIDGFALARASNALLPAGTDPFAAAPTLSDANRVALDDGLRKLRADGVPETVVDAFASYCTNASAQEVARLRPNAFAREQRLDPEQVVDACLRAAHHGLFVLMWDVLCPLCRIPSGFADSLRALEEHAHCPSCNADFPLDFAQSLELVFRVSPEVRESEVRTYCVGGPAFSPHVVAQIRLAPGERIAPDLSLGLGSYEIRSPQLPYSFPLEVTSLGRAYRGGVVFTSHTPRDSDRLLLAPGTQSVGIENSLDREILVRIERTAPRRDALTAARASSLASFRKLFPDQVLASGRLVAVGRTAFLVSHVEGQRALLERLGDARTFERVLEHLTELEEVVVGEGGAVVKTASGATLSAFETGAAAARAAASLRARLDDGASPDALDVRLAVHQGATVAATFDGRLDYFGRTVEVALELAAAAPPRCILLSSALAEDTHAMSDLTAAGHHIELTQLDDHGGYGVIVKGMVMN